MSNERKGHHKDSDYRKQAIKAAEDLYYGRDVIRKIRKAKTDNEISGIMTEARTKSMAKY